MEGQEGSYEDLNLRLMNALVEFCILVELTPITYSLHLEIVSTLLILLSTQMYSLVGNESEEKIDSSFTHESNIFIQALATPTLVKRACMKIFDS
eukprot:TRINITY_DN53098_c0_g1_i2.p1 TRINITY_DN53098_c0_g1~~TRINITY_DN53098_c0_g1_i2.p1  ORF type:complete len:102 (-),score=5.93 TRINITY_DN53098_c0_g1_i2:90-374(-)